MMKTHFASDQRAGREVIRQQYQHLRSLPHLDELVSALPYIAVILNQHRQIIFSNDTLLQQMGIDLDALVGHRPGEVLNCIHADAMAAGCGTSDHCQVCGAVNAILRCQETGKTATEECRIRVRNGTEENCLDLEVTASPFHSGVLDLVIFTARDISAEKRKEVLERIFFHDVINTAGTLQGMADLVNQLEDKQKIREFTALLTTVTRDLTHEILNQKTLLAAEKGDLAVNLQTIYLSETLDNIVKEYRSHELAKKIPIRFQEDPAEITVRTDPVLLKRIVGNMIKNALEASSEKDVVTVSVRAIHDEAEIAVQNPAPMSENVKKQVFQRSFSTKGSGRGIGTYSMRLLGQQYLKGRVDFSSNPGEGTVFYLILPYKP